MNREYIEKLKKLIDENQEKGIVNFGTSEHAVDSNLYLEAEKELGVKLSESYVWFLKNYRGGEILGDEIYSIYSKENVDIPGGDIVCMNKSNLNTGATKSHEIEITSTDFGERFFFNYQEQQGNECPIYLRIGSGKPELYATNFYEFLYKRIKEVSES